MNELLCEIQCDDGGWYIVSLGEIVASGLVSCGDAVEEAEGLGLIVGNTDDVERWMRPPGDWGLIED